MDLARTTRIIKCIQLLLIIPGSSGLLNFCVRHRPWRKRRVTCVPRCGSWAHVSIGTDKSCQVKRKNGNHGVNGGGKEAAWRLYGRRPEACNRPAVPLLPLFLLNFYAPAITAHCTALLPSSLSLSSPSFLTIHRPLPLDDCHGQTARTLHSHADLQCP